MGLEHLLYPALTPVLFGLGLRCWGRWAVRGGGGWFAGGVLLAALGVDALRVLWRRMGETPDPAQGWLVLTVVAGVLLYLFARVWRTLPPPDEAVTGQSSSSS